MEMTDPQISDPTAPPEHPPDNNAGQGKEDSLRSSEDLARGLFADKNHAMASVVRELQIRNLQRKGRVGHDLVDAQDDRDMAKAYGNEDNFSLQAPDVEEGNGAGLFILGGATTLMDCRAAGKTEKGINQRGPDIAAPELPAAQEVACVQQAKDLDGLGDQNHHLLAAPPSESGRRRCFGGVMEAIRAMADIVVLYPGTLVIPLVVFMLLAGLGIWGVIAGARSHVQQRKDDARSRAVDAATGFQIQLQQSFTPGLTFALLVRQRPELEYWIQNFNETAAELMSRVPSGSLHNLQLQPFAQVAMIYPFRPADLSQVAPPRDLLGDPGRRDDILRIITTRQPMVVGPVYLVTDSWGAFVRYPIFVPNVGANETFGYRTFYPGAPTNEPLDFSQLPASVRNCSVCYNATTREKWWGLMSVLIDYQAVAAGEDAYLANLRNMGFHYALVRPINDTAEQVIAQVGPTSLRGKEAVTVAVQVINRVWQLRVAPADGFEPPWKGPLIAAVVIIAFIIAVLLFVAIASFRRHLLLLQETVKANRDLAETTRRLEEEKERMDVLLVRQYDLLKCLDANRGGGKMDSSDPFGASKKAMMARIEDARRSLNVAKASVEENVQVFEVLGAGAFGKVQKGLWRGTVVAVKTMILPANMTGQQKREKMAVMEAAISSSLVHPNIVTTYTYFIRPYHEPTHGSVQQMLVNPTSQAGNSGAGSNGSLDDSVGADSTIHSYEVRLVLEFCDKGSLKDALDQHAFMQGNSLNLAAMLETAADVAKAMVHMHAANVLHSDLKARNIMLKSSGTEGRGVIAKVADFGLSTRMEQTETHLSSCFQGTLTHMAPEVMLEGRISKAADVYSFGILLWELFCGGDPFAGVPRAHMGHAITKEARRPKFPPFAPRDYVTLACRCWDPDAALRPSFEGVLSELGRMRDELGGDTPQLVISPPRPLSSHSSDGAGKRTGGENAGHLPGGGMAPMGIALGSGGPTTLLGAGIVLGGGSTATTGVGAGGIVELGGSGSGSGTTLIASLDGNSRSSLASRSRLKSVLAQRHLRKMGIRLGGLNSHVAISQTLPALHEEAEPKELENQPPS